MRTQMIVNGKPQDIDVPINWDGVSFRKCLELRDVKKDNTSKILSVLLGVDEDLIRRSKIVNLDAVITALGFVTKQMEYIWPETILGIKVPKALEFETTGQFEDAKLLLKNFPQKAEDVTTDHFKSYVDLVGIYTMPNYIDSNEEEKNLFAARFWDAPCSEVLAIGNFTWMKYIGLIVSTGQNSLPRTTRIKKLRLAIKAWRTRTAFSVRYFMWNLKRRSTERNF